MVRPTDQEMTALEKRVCNSQVPKEGHAMPRGTHRKAPGSDRGLRERGKCGQEPLLWCP